MKAYPLSRAQESLWVEWKHDPTDTSYNTCIRVKLKGHVDRWRLEKAIAIVVAHFDSLRSYFVEENGKPGQVFTAPSTYTLPFIDVADDIEDEGTTQQQAAFDALEGIWTQPVDLMSYPLFRAALVRSAKETYYFIGMVPHIISDGASANLFLGGVSLAYNQGELAFKEVYGQGEHDWSAYLEYLDRREDVTKQETMQQYWQDALRGAPSEVEFKALVTEDQHSSMAKRVRLALDDTVLDAVKVLASLERTTSFSVLSAALAGFLYRYTGQDDVVMGYPVSLRPPGYKNVFGMLVNVVPLRVQIDGSTSFRALVKQIHAQRKQDKKAQTLPALDIVRALRKQTGVFAPRLFNVSLLPTVSRLQGLDLDGIESDALDSPEIHLKEDLSFVYEASVDGMTLWLEYRDAAFSDAAIKELQACFERFLVGITRDADKAIDVYPLFSDAQRRVLIAKGEGDVGIYPKQGVHRWIEQQVVQHPDAIAAIHNGSTIVYAELNARANDVAQYIKNEGLRAGQPVSICIDRSFEQLIAVLGVLKSGHPYVPIDPSYPQDRIDHIIYDAGSTVMLTAEKIQDIPRVSLDFTSAEIVQDAPAYIIYTSGTTGKPKGVVINHHGVSARLAYMQRVIPLNVDDPVLCHVSFSFDASIVELFLTLSQGATLVLVSSETQRDVRVLCHVIKVHQIVLASFVPSLTRVLLRELPSETSLKTVISMGEAVPDDLPALFHTALPDATLYNFYGPTEATVYVSYDQCKPDEPVTIGSVFDNVSLYILNNALEPQSVGVPGILYIGGQGLAGGYYRQPDLTSSRFIESPMGRLYNTGDLASWLDDGRIRHLGRADTQVKIRGFRIELDEIASVLRTVVDDAVVSIKKIGGRDIICAYYVGSTDEETALRRAVSMALPTYMHPATYTLLESVPKSPNGKVDEHALPSPIMAMQQKVIIAPETPLEKLLLEIWSKVLRMEVADISTHDNFFSLGGDSLMVLEILCGIEEEGYYIAADAIFTHQTIAGLAAVAQKVTENTNNEVTVHGEFPMLPRHRKFIADGFAHPHWWNRCISIAFKVPLDVGHLQASINYLVQHHDGLRLYIDNAKAHIAEQVESPVLEYAYDVTAIAEILNDIQQGMVLDQPPLMRVVWFKKPDGTGILSLIFHHLLIDMRSCQIVLEDLLKLYQQQVMGQPLQLPQKTTSLLKWSAWLQQYDCRDSLPFWQDQLGSSRELPVLLEKDQDAVTLVFDVGQTERLRNVAPLQDITFAGIAEAYKEWSGESQLYVNTCSHGRDVAPSPVNLNRTVGWINTVYPLSFDLAPADMLPEIQQKIQAIPDKGVSFGVLKYVRQESSLRNVPEPQVFYNYVSRIDTALPARAPFELLENIDGVMASHVENRTCYALYIEAALVDGALNIRFTYNRKKYNVTEIDHLTNLVTDRLLWRLDKQNEERQSYA